MTYSNLNQFSLSLNHDLCAEKLINTKNKLIIQDLDGVCMGLVKNPLHRVIDFNYVKAARNLHNHFYVLTNGEHIGKFGVNHIIEKSAPNPEIVKKEGYYLSGLAGGGVQWQDNYGKITYPGVKQEELTFLSAIPAIFEERLRNFCQNQAPFLTEEVINEALDAVILVNQVSPTINLNTFFSLFADHPHLYLALQKEIKALMDELLDKAQKNGLKHSFFLHLAPNLGRDEEGVEIMKEATENDSGTTDFQFMLKGAVKEAGVLYILNHYYYLHTGEYPLGQDFSPQQAPNNHQELVNLVIDKFSPESMPLIMGVGDTVNSQVTWQNGKKIVKRGGSDRNFLQLIQDIGKGFNIDNIIAYVDSSGGEVKNRKPIKVENIDGNLIVTEGIAHPDDSDEPLNVNFVFPEGHRQYCQFFQKIAS
ncbi:glucosylglycerol 3-phosphatase [Cyanobacterium aponinum AL20118]|uniref:Glucosylglycerol 3-phosphatase n=1 Tax=Cyanobacterium aponinum AL20115 TaxID=3090662 RepID=A0AAF1C070_9CHRO|nr:glucosylglycerol 3-phosphatase [Cyanobacterium aponinum]WPF87277.1 glucosylglycerol 3-phosphatase [Cyanobacterium aponinum AL20115]